MMESRDLTYPADHWLRADDPEVVLEASLRQQALAYSRVKNILLWGLIGDPAGTRFLDYGCGAGFFTVNAARRGAALAMGLDALAPSLAGARLLARRQGVAEGCVFVPSSSPEVLAGEKPFDIILLRDVLEHVADDAGLLSRAATLLAPGGRLVLATQNAFSLNYLLEGTVRRVLLKQRDWRGWDPTHRRFYTPARLTRLLAEAALRPRAWRSTYLIPHKIPLPAGYRRQFLRIECLTVLDLILGRRFPFDRLGWSLMVMATR